MNGARLYYNRTKNEPGRIHNDGDKLILHRDTKIYAPTFFI